MKKCLTPMIRFIATVCISLILNWGGVISRIAQNSKLKDSFWFKNLVHAKHALFLCFCLWLFSCQFVFAQPPCYLQFVNWESNIGNDASNCYCTSFNCLSDIEDKCCMLPDLAISKWITESEDAFGGHRSIH